MNTPHHQDDHVTVYHGDSLDIPLARHRRRPTPHERMTETRHLCPVCHRPVKRTKHHNIAGHFDKNKTICPASYRTYDITLIDETCQTPEAQSQP